MRPAAIVTLAACIAATCHASDILYNQVGYYPNAPKHFEVADSDATSFELIDSATDSVVLSGSLSAPEPYTDAGIAARHGDFSSWTTAGNYFLRLSDGAISGTFAIDEQVHLDALKASLKSFYYNRSSMALDEAHAGIYARPLGHPDTKARYHSSSGRPDGFAPSPKGWYDAGDYGKYIVNGGYTLGTLLGLHELYPNAIGDNLDIPESGNGVSDLLDECRWEIDWFLTMQDEDGGVFHKLTTLHFAGFVMPDQADAQRYFIGKSTQATLNFAATMAQASRIFSNIDQPLAQRCRDAAKRAWLWAVAHPETYFSNPTDVSTGGYAENDASDEFVWAAAEIAANGDRELVWDKLEPAVKRPQLDTAATWGGTRNLGYYTLAVVDSDLPKADRKRVQAAIVAKADEVLAEAAANPIGIPMSGNEFQWGSNGTVAGKGVLLAYAHAITGEQKYLRGAQATADYLLGRNPTTYSFLTGYGAKTPMNIHHRPSGADGIPAPIPGFLAGGPNGGRQDHVAYAHPEPARSYADLTESYASNEIAINWNAPLVLLLGALESSDFEQ